MSASQVSQFREEREMRLLPVGLFESFELVGNPVILPAIECFIACDDLKVGLDGEVPIAYLGGNLMTHFHEIIEEDVRPVTVVQRKPRTGFVELPTLSMLYGQKKVQIAFAHVFEFLKTAEHALWYTFCVADTEGVHWAVSSGWDKVGWYIGASLISCQYEMSIVDRIVSTCIE